MRSFGNDGPCRSELGNKIQYEGFLSPLTIRRFGEYMRKHQVQEDGQLRDCDNWQKRPGIDKKSYMDSLIRHMIDVWGIHRGCWELSDDGDGIEDLLCAVMFNVMGYLHELQMDKEKTPTNNLRSGVERRSGFGRRLRSKPIDFRDRRTPGLRRLIHRRRV